MPDTRRTYISSVTTAKKNGASPDKRRKYDEAFKADVVRRPPAGLVVRSDQGSQ